MEERKVISAFKINCLGVNPQPKESPEPIEVSLVISSDGSRDVGCPYLGYIGNYRGNCLKNGDLTERFNCFQLYPVNH